MLRSAGWLALLSLFVAACTGGSTDTSQLPASTTSEPPARIATSTTAATEPPPPPQIAVPAGVVWQVGTVPTVEGFLSMRAVDSVPSGWSASGGTVDESGNLQLIVWHSSDGLEWESADTSALPAGVVLSAFAGFGDTTVAVGSELTDCVESAIGIKTVCRNGRAAAAVSTDGGLTWMPATAADDSFTGGSGGRGTALFDVAVAPDGAFIASGRDERSGLDWPTQVWRSTDGASWVRIAELATDWPALDSALHVVGDRLTLVFDDALCATPFDNGPNGWVLGVFGYGAHLYWSDDGKTWTSDAIIEEGLTAELPEDFDCGPTSQPEGTSGVFHSTDATITFTGNSGIWSADGPGTWEQLASEPIPFFNLSRTGETWVSFRFISEPASLTVQAEKSTDLVEWEDLHGLSPRLAPITSAVDGSAGRVHRTAAAEGFLVAAGTDASSGALQPFFVRSEAAMVDPPGTASCEPAPDADCADVDFDDGDLSGADLSGANLRFANLRDVDLSGASLVGADLTGADLSSAVMTGVDATGANFLGASFFLTVYDGADFTEADLTGSNIDPLPVATWDRAMFIGVSIVLVSSDGAIAFELEGSDLSGASFQGDLTGSNFRGANLTNARFSGTLVDVDFSGAVLSGTGFSGDLTGSRFAETSVGDAHWFADICPDGFEVPVTYPPTNCDGHFVDG